ncbi:DUF4239 domain-containing protein [uncultured Reyranella sp.]|uniref:bestrophin-like domain n=1 Tax=uncultured Reyranella sp. TaxID=735512 RepID=UPI0025FC7C70|nr:DUF4239 domain-containing protein [uncultured Reyranella sp.]
MSAVETALLVLGVILISTAAGVLLRRKLPEKHLSGDSKDVIKLATALVATMAALVTALLFASTRASYEATHSQVGQLTANVIELDRLLKDYGAEGVALRQALRQDVAAIVNTIWRDDDAVALSPAQASASEAQVITRLRLLAPHDPVQTSLQARASVVSNSLAQIQLTLYAHPSDSLAKPFITVLVLWLCFIFGSFAMSADANGTMLSVLFFCALSAASAIYLILELGQPFDGLMQVPSGPLRHALAPL